METLQHINNNLSVDNGLHNPYIDSLEPKICVYRGRVPVNHFCYPCLNKSVFVKKQIRKVRDEEVWYSITETKCAYGDILMCSKDNPCPHFLGQTSLNL